MPRTVCTNRSCVEFKNDGNGENKMVTIYKMHCHASCYLTNVRPDEVAHPGLIHCAAFSGHTNCLTCYHSWQEHLHVLYELEERTIIVNDTLNEEQVSKNKNDATFKQQAIAKLEVRVAEYRAEHKQIQWAAAQFGLFLKKNSLTSYNDATIAHLDSLIKEETYKVEAGGDRQKLDRLDDDRQHYKEYMDAIDLALPEGEIFDVMDEAKVKQEVEKLYDLKHFGMNLKNVKNSITQIHEATYRERPHRAPGSRWQNFSSARGLLSRINGTTSSSAASVSTRFSSNVPNNNRAQGQSLTQQTRNLTLQSNDRPAVEATASPNVGVNANVSQSVAASSWTGGLFGLFGR